VCKRLLCMLTFTCLLVHAGCVVGALACVHRAIANCKHSRERYWGMPDLQEITAHL
jgi:murein endopeptidase